MSGLFLLADAAQNDGGAAAGAGIFAGLFLFWVILAIAATVFTIWMLVDVLISNKETNEKILWVLVILFANLLGAIIYFFVGRSKRIGTLGSP